MIKIKNNRSGRRKRIRGLKNRDPKASADLTPRIVGALLASPPLKQRDLSTQGEGKERFTLKVNCQPFYLKNIQQ
jgi:hypothetical protein